MKHAVVLAHPRHHSLNRANTARRAQRRGLIERATGAQAPSRLAPALRGMMRDPSQKGFIP